VRQKEHSSAVPSIKLPKDRRVQVRDDRVVDVVHCIDVDVDIRRDMQCIREYVIENRYNATPS
jgi:hypothetical protein